MYCDMKRFLFFILLSFATVPSVGAKSKIKTLIQPAFLTSDMVERISRIDYDGKATTLHINYTCPPYNDSWKAISQYFIVTGDNDTLLSTAEGGKVLSRSNASLPVRPLKTDSTYPLAYDSLILSFPPLSPGTKTLSLFKTTPYGKRHILGIRTDGKRYTSIVKEKHCPYASADTLPNFQPHYGKAKVHGRIYGFYYPDDLGFWISGNSNSFTDDVWNMTVNDSPMGENWKVLDLGNNIGSYSIEMDISYPQPVSFNIADEPINLLMFPGEDVELNIDLCARSRFLSEKKKGHSRSAIPPYIHYNGQMASVFAVNGIMQEWSLAEATFKAEDQKEHINDNFATYTQRKWNDHLQRLHEMEQIKELTPAQKEYLRLVSEKLYIESHTAHKFLLTKKLPYELLNNDELEKFATQAVLTDSRSEKLQYPNSLRSCYVSFNTDLLPYFKANRLLKTPYGQWLQEVEQGKQAVKRIQLLNPIVGTAAWDTIPSQFHSELKKINEAALQTIKESCDTATHRCQTPEGSQKEYLSKILAEHKGRIILIDFWATWCGPCLQGMKAMESIKPALSALGTDFVYITDETSDIAAWNSLIKTHRGYHYKISTKDIREMNIPHYSGAIPLYLLFDKQGNLVFHQEGFSEGLLEELRTQVNALQD